MSFIDNLKDKLKAMVGKKDNVNAEVPVSPVVETPVMEESPIMEQPQVVVEEVVTSPNVEAVIDQVTTDMGDISTSTDAGVSVDSN